MHSGKWWTLSKLVKIWLCSYNSREGRILSSLNVSHVRGTTLFSCVIWKRRSQELTTSDTPGRFISSKLCESFSFICKFNLKVFHLRSVTLRSGLSSTPAVKINTGLCQSKYLEAATLDNEIVSLTTIHTPYSGKDLTPTPSNMSMKMSLS